VLSLNLHGLRRRTVNGSIQANTGNRETKAGRMLKSCGDSDPPIGRTCRSKVVDIYSPMT
jgi:hypothetical protein